jgi:ATP adenylyltransferase/5',5'''-P-1,P-4-tetraphosphate phosphorylase II
LLVAAFTKEALQNCRALVFQNAGCNIAPVIQCRHLQKVHYTSGRSGRRICATENHTSDPFILALIFFCSYDPVSMKTSIANCLLAVGLLLVATAPLTSAGNLIINGDFETGTFAGWTTIPAPIRK